MPRTKRTVAAALKRFALALPEAYEDDPWGELVVKVNKKIFVFFGRQSELDRELSFSVKLPASGVWLLEESFAKPTAYGLGKSGWVTVTFEGTSLPPTDMLCSWIEESYRSLALKRLVKELDGAQAPEKKTSTKPARRKKTSGKKKAKTSKTKKTSRRTSKKKKTTSRKKRP